MNTSYAKEKVLAHFNRFISCATELAIAQDKLKENFAPPKNQYSMSLEDALEYTFRPVGGQEHCDIQSWLIIYHNQYKILASEFEAIARRFLPIHAVIRMNDKVSVYLNLAKGFYLFPNTISFVDDEHAERFHCSYIENLKAKLGRQ